MSFATWFFQTNLFPLSKQNFKRGGREEKLCEVYRVLKFEMVLVFVSCTVMSKAQAWC